MAVVIVGHVKRTYSVSWATRPWITLTLSADALSVSAFIATTENNAFSWSFPQIWSPLGSSQLLTNERAFLTVGILDSKMPTVRNARSLVTSRELPSGLQIWGKRPAKCIVLSGYNEGWHRQRVRRERQSNSRSVAHGTLYVRLTCPTMDNRHNKPRSSSRILTVRNFKFNLSTF